MEISKIIDYNTDMKKILMLMISLNAFVHCLNCSSCGFGIKGQYWKGNGQYGEVVYCENCYKNLRRCDICKRPDAILPEMFVMFAVLLSPAGKRQCWKKSGIFASLAETVQ